MYINSPLQPPFSNVSLASRKTSHSDEIAVSVISNSRLFREGIVSLLEAHLTLHMIGSYTGAVDYNDTLPNPEGHVVLLDSGIGQQAAITWTRRWRNLVPPAFVVVLELANEPQTILNCIEAGASAYTVQDTSPAEVAYSIWLVRQGKAQCSPDMVRQLFSRLAELGEARSQQYLADTPLTSRELEVLRCLAKGYSNKEIAADLVIELCTVKHHVHNILSKLAQKHRWAAVDHARQLGWLDAAK
jgi:DNA-binding NarL/FixJ family response regulator